MSSSDIEKAERMAAEWFAWDRDLRSPIARKPRVARTRDWEIGFWRESDEPLTSTIQLAGWLAGVMDTEYP